MGLLDDLRKEAEALQTRESAKVQNLREIAASVDLSLRNTFQYLNEMFKHLNVVKPPCPITYDLATVGPLSGLIQSDYRIEYRTSERYDAEHYEYLVVILKRAKPEKMRASREGPEIERFRDVLWQNNMRFSSDVFRNDRRVVTAEVFSIECEVVCGVDIIGNYETGLIDFKFKNMTEFGHATYRVPAAALKEEALEELAKLLVGSPSDFRKFQLRVDPSAITGSHKKVAMLDHQYLVNTEPELSDEEIEAAEAKRRGLLGSLKSVFKK